MCAVADSEPYDYHSKKTIKAARKQHKCSECRRFIRIGESYELAKGGYRGDRPATMKTCVHCQVVCRWLLDECHGYLYFGVYEDICEHIDAYCNDFQRAQRFGLMRFAAGMRRHWAGFKDSHELMKLPKQVVTGLTLPDNSYSYSHMDTM